MNEKKHSVFFFEKSIQTDLVSDGLASLSTYSNQSKVHMVRTAVRQRATVCTYSDADISEHDIVLLIRAMH